MALPGIAPEGRHCELPLHPFGCAKGVRQRGNLIFRKVRLPPLGCPRGRLCPSP